MARKRSGVADRAVKARDTRAGGRLSGCRNICLISGLGADCSCAAVGGGCAGAAVPSQEKKRLHIIPAS